MALIAESNPAPQHAIPSPVIHPPDDALLKAIADSTVYDIRHLLPYDARASGFIKPHRSDRPWGYELWLARTPEYCMKEMHIDEGAILSVQYHPQKDETLSAVSGMCRVLLGEQGDLDHRNAKCYRFGPGSVVRIEPHTVHTFQALEDSVLYEVSRSLPEEEHTSRLLDFYGRK